MGRHLSLPPRHAYCNLRCRMVPLSAGDGSADVSGPAQSGTRATGADTDDAGDPFDPDDDGPYRVHGIAIPENGLTFGENEEWVFWPEDVARSTEGQVAGRNIIDLHPESPTNDDVIGEVTEEKYLPGVGLAWSGEVDSRRRAKQVHRGRLDASPYLFAHDGGDAELPENAPENTIVASSVSKVRDIGMVPDGAIEDSQVQPGPHPDMSGENGDVQAALAAGFDESEGDGDGRTYKSEGGEGRDMGSKGGDDDPTVQELQELLKEVREERDALQTEVKTLRQPYLEAVTADSDLSAEQVNMSAEELAEYFSGDVGEGGEGGPDPEADGTEGASETALSAAPLTATGEAPPGSGSSKALSEGDGGGSTDQSGSEADDVEAPDESLEVLQQRRDLMRDRGTDEYRETLDAQIAAKERENN